MYRIFILSLLAIVFSTFALEPSQVILRATEIRGDTIVLEWSPLEWAKSYKVFYDEESLINPKSPEPILESTSTDKTRIEIPKMMEWTQYYLIVHWFDDTGAKIGETLPLHASTFRAPLFVLKDSEVVDDQNISLTFSHAIDLKKTQIEIVNTETKKSRTIKEITLSPEDLRIVQIRLEGKMAPDMSHDIVLKKVTDISGMDMPPESRKTSTIIFVTEPVLVPEKTQFVETKQDPLLPDTWDDMEAKNTVASPAIQPDEALDGLQKKTEELGIERVDVSIPLESEDPEKTPVEIDQLPQTGTSLYVILSIALFLWATLSYRKKTSI